MRGIVKTFRRTPACRPGDRNGGFPRLSDSVAHVSRCPASPRRTLLAESLGKPSLWVFISAAWYKPRSSPAARSPRASGSSRPAHPFRSEASDFARRSRRRRKRPTGPAARRAIAQVSAAQVSAGSLSSLGPASGSGSSAESALGRRRAWAGGCRGGGVIGCASVGTASRGCSPVPATGGA